MLGDPQTTPVTPVRPRDNRKKSRDEIPLVCSRHFRMTVARELIPRDHIKCALTLWLPDCSHQRNYFQKDPGRNLGFPKSSSTVLAQCPFPRENVSPRESNTGTRANRGHTYVSDNWILSLRMFLPLTWLQGISGLGLRTTCHGIRQSLTERISGVQHPLVSAVGPLCRFCSGFFVFIHVFL